jgi:hypothetical protein
VNQDVPFQGDSVTIMTALTVSGNVVRLNAPNPSDMPVNPATLRIMQEQQKNIWVISDQTGQKMFKFMASITSPAVLKVDNSKPVVTVFDVVQQDVGFMGDSMTILTALTSSGNVVRLVKPLPGSDITVNPATLFKFQIPNEPAKFAWVVMSVDGNPLKKLYFLGMINNPNQLQIMFAKPAVLENPPKRSLRR